MYLEKLECQGFKSFANKNVLVFPGMVSADKRGITAVVGPNGSGKSNVADAIRWALGEQSMKTLRGKKGEDVIFSGSDKKGKLSMAEVSMHFNNESGKAPIDYSQIVITRRLYRNGESEYLMNNNRVRLSDVQMFLAKAKFGQKTYSVIGQGTVEGFLNTSLSERKEFFDEATGVKQFQIKRDEALNKMRASYENLNQAHMLMVEIEPRIKSLTRQVSKLRKRGELEEQLRDFQKIYYRKVWHDNNDKFCEYNQSYLEIEKTKMDKDKRMELLNKELGRLENQNSINQEFISLQSELGSLQSQRDEVNKRVAKIEAELEVDLESRGQFDLSFLTARKSELKKEISKIEDDLNLINERISQKRSEAQKMIAEKAEADKESAELNSRMMSFTSKTEDVEINKINEKINLVFNRLEDAEKEDNMESIRIIISEVKESLRKIMNISQEDKKVEDIGKIQLELTVLAEKKEKIINEFSEVKTELATIEERKRSIDERKKVVLSDLNNVEAKLAQGQNKVDASALAGELKKMNEELFASEKRIEETKEKIGNISRTEEEKRNKLFTLQRSTQALQIELNIITNELGEIKIKATRYETKLEDLENEIRDEFGSMKQIKEKRVEGDVDILDLQEQIKNIKKQLEHIGGIDPEVETEYVDTKERFDFLTTQVDDLTSTIKSLETIIKELDLTIKDIFDKEFKIISAKFEEYFKILFNGGKAKIIKVMEQDKEKETPEGEDVKEKKEEEGDGMIGGVDIKRIKFLQKHNATGLAGIEIQATPPGKKISSVSMLSGGERALTAIALISAIISANPSPFVVLDEVDAALDEANSERLAKILDDLSHKTQFIVITHNRASMRRANILYGVTMGDDGISQLLSIKLEDAKSVARN